MRSDKPNARNLAELAAEHGITHAVISPGSRNAPLTISLSRHPGIRTISAPDERSAAFIALGIGQRTKVPAILTCTSGTAGLNYSPAIAEAHYQRIPMVVVTADRPNEWIDQMDGQTIQQKDLFQRFTRYSAELPQEPTDRDSLWHVGRTVNEAMLAAKSPIPGPVHLNAPFKEPLFGTRAWENEAIPRVITKSETTSDLTDDSYTRLKKDWDRAEKVMIIAGMDEPDGKRDEQLDLLIREKWIPVLTETTSNVQASNSIRNIDRTLATIPDQKEEEFAPDLLITLGGPIVSKKIKQFLRCHLPEAHWHVDPGGKVTDTFQALTEVIPTHPSNLLYHIAGWGTSDGRKEFGKAWAEKSENGRNLHSSFLKETEWSDLKAFELILENLPENGEVQLGNSSPVRYVQLFDHPTKVIHKSNRGTSGIDGVLSTGVGSAMVSEEPVTVITGDVSFFYDSNGLWTDRIPENLRVIMINNGGGGIFRIIDGPSEVEELETYFETAHEHSAKDIANTFGVTYYFSGSKEELKKELPRFYGEKGPALLEVGTPREKNAELLRQYFKALKSNN